ncbi:hypothetical protein [Delftia sp. ASV31]|uniref:hypothetical protein n=1 Tax=Delftia sp. ASV31 TaxID=2795113 RepID=UPI001E459F1F|nr:hypothetical protein [Delftia sp. ASV31]
MERGEEADAVRLDMRLAQLDGAAGLVDKHISNLVKARRRIQASDEPSKRDQVKAINLEIEISMRQLNSLVEDVLARMR